MAHTQVDVLNNNDRTFASPTSPLTQYNIYTPGGFKLTVTASAMDTSTHLMFYRNDENYDWPVIWKGAVKAKVIGTPPPKGMGMGYLAILSIKVFQGEGYANDYWVFEWLRTHSQPLPVEPIDLGTIPSNPAIQIPTSSSHAWYKVKNSVASGGLKFLPVETKDSGCCFDVTVVVDATVSNSLTVYDDYTVIIPTGTFPAVGKVGLLRCTYTPYGRRYYWI